MPFAVFASLLLAAGAPASSDGAAVDAFLRQVYAPYEAGGAAGQQAYWDRPIFAAGTHQLIEAWKHSSNGEADDVSDADMLCACQDWEAADFRVDTLTRQFAGPGRAVLLLRVWPMKRRNSTVRLSLVKEGSRWLIDDIGDPGGQSLTMVLRRAIGGAARGNR